MRVQDHKANNRRIAHDSMTLIFFIFFYSVCKMDCYIRQDFQVP